MNDPQTDELLSICKSFNQAMLVTHTPDGRLVARPMAIAELESTGDLWFVTDRETGKVDEIRANNHVCVTMADDGKFVSLSGQALIINDHDKVEKLWNESWRVWFPDGPTDPRLVLIKVHAMSGEYWSQAGTQSIKYLFKATKAYLQGQRPEMDSSQHARVKF